MSYPQYQGRQQQPPYPPQQAYQQPNQWPQPAYGTAAPPQPMPQQPMPQGMPQPGVLQCRLCGCVPAARTTFRGHQGILVVMRFLSLAGPFCHDCGMATYRRMTGDTLLQGWWGYASSVITPVTVLINLTRRGKVANLPAPVPPPDGRHGRPLDPGKPLYARPQTWIGLCLPFFVLFMIIMFAVLSSHGS